MAKVAFRRGVWVFDRIANDGRRKVTKCKDERDANEKLTRYLKRRELGLPPDEEISRRKLTTLAQSGSTELSRAIVEFGDKILKPKRKPKTLAIEQGFLQTMYDLLFDDGVYFVESVEPRHVDGLLAKLKERYSPGAVNRIFGVHKQFFKTMVRWGLLAKDPSADIGQLKVKPKKKRIWEPGTREEILAETPEYAHDCFEFIAEAGCRPGQATGLLWEDVAWDQRTWHTTSEKGGVVKDLYFPLEGRSFELLKKRYEQARRRFAAGPKQPVFLNAEGTGPIRTDYLYTMIKRAERKINARRKREGLEPKTFGFCTYGLRTTFGTTLVREGMPIKFVAELMGHSDTRTTEQWYVQDVSQAAREAFEKRRVNR